MKLRTSWYTIESNIEKLKNYLINEDKKDLGFLLNHDNNGKTIMLSGAWGAGKTHFWKEEIEREQSKIFIDGNEKVKYEDKEYKEGLSYLLKDKKKACVYVSLYGKDSLDDIKQEIFLKASTENDYLSEDIEAFGYRALSSISDTDGIIGTLFKTAIDLNEYRKHGKGENKLKQGGIICFDDFERKSKKIDLNDLFGFISQLAIVLKCKVVIILNSDVFEGEEKNVFKNLKEKTVNKFFYFEPTIEELFYSIANDEKYKSLDDYKKEILKAIEEAEELNARIYIQVLDNCLEWLDKGYDDGALRELVLCTVFFIKNHYVFDFTIDSEGKQVYTIIQDFDKNTEIALYLRNIFPQHGSNNMNSYEIIHIMRTNINKKAIDDKGKTLAEEYHVQANKIFENNQELFRDFYRYVYELKIDLDFDNTTHQQINNFIKTGILQKQTKEVESSLPPEAVLK